MPKNTETGIFKEIITFLITHRCMAIKKIQIKCAKQVGWLFINHSTNQLYQLINL
jgi:hypothetical protein